MIDKYVTHYDAWCAVMNVRNRYEDELDKKHITGIDIEGLDDYVNKQTDILREKAEKHARIYKYVTYVTHYDAWCAVMNVRNRYEDELDKKHITGIDIEGLEDYVNKQTDILREKAEKHAKDESGEPMTCPYCGDQMTLTFRDSNNLSRVSRGNHVYGISDLFVHYRCWRCGATSPSVSVHTQMLDEKKVRKTIDKVVTNAKIELADEQADDWEEE